MVRYFCGNCDVWLSHSFKNEEFKVLNFWLIILVLGHTTTRTLQITIPRLRKMWLMDHQILMKPFWLMRILCLAFGLQARKFLDCSFCSFPFRTVLLFCCLITCECFSVAREYEEPAPSETTSSSSSSSSPLITSFAGILLNNTGLGGGQSPPEQPTNHTASGSQTSNNAQNQHNFNVTNITVINTAAGPTGVFNITNIWTFMPI